MHQIAREVGRTVDELVNGSPTFGADGEITGYTFRPLTYAELTDWTGFWTVEREDQETAMLKAEEERRRHQ